MLSLIEMKSKGYWGLKGNQGTVKQNGFMWPQFDLWVLRKMINSYAITMIGLKSRVSRVERKSRYCEANEYMSSQYDWNEIKVMWIEIKSNYCDWYLDFVWLCFSKKGNQINYELLIKLVILFIFLCVKTLFW